MEHRIFYVAIVLAMVVSGGFFLVASSNKEAKKKRSRDEKVLKEGLLSSDNEARPPSVRAPPSFVS